MTDLVPIHQLGYVLPVPVGDYIHYQFYKACSDGCFLVAKPLLNLSSFSKSGSEAAIEQFWPAVDFLKKRGVHRISQGGIPVSCFLGRPRMLQMMDEMQQRTGIPCSVDFEETIQGFQELGVAKVALAAKWDDALYATMRDYLAHAGIQVVGQVGEPHTAAQVMDVAPQAGLDMALSLGRKAFTNFPDAEGVLLGGGAWLSMPSIPILEAEFGKPVVSNPTASYWAFMKQRGAKAIRGNGRLLDTIAT